MTATQLRSVRVIGLGLIGSALAIAGSCATINIPGSTDGWELSADRASRAGQARH